MGTAVRQIIITGVTVMEKTVSHVANCLMGSFYGVALARKLDKKPEIASELSKRRDDLMYEKYFLNEITQKTTVSDTEIADYYKTHKDEFLKSKLSDVQSQIRNQIFTTKRQAMYETVANNLKLQAKIEINEKLIMSAGKHKIKTHIKTGGQ